VSLSPISERRARVLVVEDDLANRVLLTRLLERAGYDVVAVEDGTAAVRGVVDARADVVLLDVGLPGIDGLEVCRQLRDDTETAAVSVILLTGRTAVEDVVEGLDAGADDFLRKPYDTAELLARMRSVLRLRTAMAEMEAAHGVVAALANAVEAKDVTTEHHCQRLAGYAQRLGAAIGIAGDELRAILFGALLHDVGKIGVSEAILTKPAALTETEWAEMRRHPEIGEQICRPLASSRLFAPIVRHHHERWDGKGYPDGLRDESIPIGARIVGLVDAFDAMVNDRPYRRALPVEAAIAELRTQSARQFDPDLVPAFLDVLDPSLVGTQPEGRLTSLAAQRLPA
jgi:putative two-component system response regulator